MEKPILVFQTDFTYKEGAVCSMYGVVKTVDRSLEIFDGTHEIPQYDIRSASYRLYQYMKFWPKGTIFVSVVDPGVGTARKACIARTKDGYYVVTPDNGTLTHVKHFVGIEEVREIDEASNRLKSTLGTSVFHGRDLFGYCAAKLASGLISYEEVGPAYNEKDIITFEIEDAIVEKGKATGIIEICDPNFGNLWSNIPVEDLLNNGFHYGDMVRVRVKKDGKLVFEDKVPFHKSFGFVKKGDLVLYTNEMMKASMAVNMGSFQQEYEIGYGPDWKVELNRSNAD